MILCEIVQRESGYSCSPYDVFLMTFCNGWKLFLVVAARRTLLFAIFYMHQPIFKPSAVLFHNLCKSTQLSAYAQIDRKDYKKAN